MRQERMGTLSNMRQKGSGSLLIARQTKYKREEDSSIDSLAENKTHEERKGSINILLQSLDMSRHHLASKRYIRYRKETE